VTEAPSARISLAARLWQTATITAIAVDTPRVKTFSFQASRPFSFIAGQHAEVRLTAPDGYRAQRNYSISSAPETAERIDLTIEQLDNGEVSPFFHEVAEVGDEIELRGPLGGHFVWSVADGGPLLLIAGGSGIAPLMSMLRHRKAQNSALPTLLIYSARSWVEVVFRDELLDMDNRDDGFKLVFALTRENARRPGDYSRRVDAAMMVEVLALLPAAPKHVLICGSNMFVEAASDGTIAAGIQPDTIRTERYGM
jgi:ferredoxin-NADP reductase